LVFTCGLLATQDSRSSWFMPYGPQGCVLPMLLVKKDFLMLDITLSELTRGGGRRTLLFQVCYDEKLGVQRSELLKSRGYDAISVIGNEAAKVVLSSIQHYDLFIVGHAAPKETRRDIVAWLRANYPGVKILALNPPNQQILGADYNVRQNGPETWLPIVSQQLSNSASSGG
jgi:hypothetical protein